MATEPASGGPEVFDSCYGSGNTAGHLEQSERDILNLRSQQGRFEERVAMMQGLLKVSQKEQCIALSTSIIMLHACASMLASAAMSALPSLSSQTPDLLQK